MWRCPTKIDSGVLMHYTSTGLEDHPPRGSRPHTGSPPQTQVPRSASPCRNIERVQIGSGVSVTINPRGRPIPDIGRNAGGSASLDAAVSRGGEQCVAWTAEPDSRPDSMQIRYGQTHKRTQKLQPHYRCHHRRLYCIRVILHALRVPWPTRIWESSW